MPRSKPSPTRRDFLRTAAAGAAGVALAADLRGTSVPQFLRGTSVPRLATAKSCIFINLVGGPSHLDTFDPKPDAPAEVGGPFRPIQTNVPGLHLSELFPKMAAMADKFSLIRSLHHDAPPIHEAGFQLLNTGHLFRDGPERPSVGAVVTHLLGERDLCPPWWHMPGGDIITGIAVSHGQGSGFLPLPDYYPCRPQLAGVRFDTSCKCASLAVRSGGRFVTVNMFNTVFDAPSWDCHADRGSLRTDLSDYRDTVAPAFDTAFAALLTDLEERGLLDSTLVVATGEFGRTPHLNANGGRDHWAGCWTAIVAGGGVNGGRVIGASDRIGSEPANRPVKPPELVATIFHALGVPASATIPGPTGEPVAVYPGQPVTELF